MSSPQQPFYALWGSSEPAPAPAAPAFQDFSANSDGLFSGSPELVQAKLGLQLFTQLFNRSVDTCFRKCMSNPGHSEILEAGEQACVDRCVSKFVQAMNVCDEAMNNISRQQAEQQANLAAQQKSLGF